MRSRLLFVAFLSLGTASAQQSAAPAPPRALDHTGIAWRLPFAAAQAQAKEQQRLIFVPVIAGGTNATGCW